MGVSRKYKPPENKDKKKKRKVKVGDQYLTNTFACVKVHTEIVKIENEEKGIYMGKLLRKEDVKALIDASVPWKKDENPEDCVGVVYDFQIIKKINTGRKKQSGPKRRYARKKINN
tara:strand:- start:282 stop:629 length:348 start_codon:yes stop_codon:yes gene_type:complete